MDKKKKDSLKRKRREASLGNPALQSRQHEICMPQEHMEQIFDSSKRLGYESPEEKEIRLRKEAYNETILDQIKKVPLTDRQKEIMTLMFGKDNLTLSETARYLNVTPQSILLVKKRAINKIRNQVSYDFISDEKPLF